MTEAKMNKMCFFKIKTEKNQDTWSVQGNSGYFTTRKPLSDIDMEELIWIIYDMGVNQGIEQGKTEKANQIKKLLYIIE